MPGLGAAAARGRKRLERIARPLQPLLDLPDRGSQIPTVLLHDQRELPQPVIVPHPRKQRRVVQGDVEEALEGGGLEGPLTLPEECPCLLEHGLAARHLLLRREVLPAV